MVRNYLYLKFFKLLSTILIYKISLSVHYRGNYSGNGFLIFTLAIIQHHLHMSGRKSTVQEVSRKVHTIYKTKSLGNYLDLLHPRLPEDGATKSIYDHTAKTDKCITLCDYQLILVISL